jgi:hypothetical protein
VDLCIGITPAISSVGRGSPADWVISAWTTGGNIPDATLWLQASPTTVMPQFSFGCGTYDGSASCDLGAIDSQSAERELQAQVTVPATASVSSVKLTAIGSAAYLPTDPEVAATITITGTPTPSTSPLPIGSLPEITSTPSPSLSPGGNAGGLFPTLTPSGQTDPGKPANARVVADTSALPQGAQVVGAQLVGLAALALAFVLAVTRLSIRRRPAAATAGSATPGSAGPDPAKAEGPAGSTPKETPSAEAPAAASADETPSTPQAEGPAQPDEDS